MLLLERWRDAPLTLHFFNSSYLTAHAACPALPLHVRLNVAPMEVGGTFHDSVSISMSLTQKHMLRSDTHAIGHETQPSLTSADLLLQALPTVVDDDYDCEDPHGGSEENSSEEGASVRSPPAARKARG